MSTLSEAEEAKRRYAIVAKAAAAARARRQIADKARENFRTFIEASWPVVEPSRAFKPGWHIDAIADHMQAVKEGKVRNLLITISPGSAKPVWEEEYVLEKRRGRIRLKEIQVGDFVLTHLGRFRKVLSVHQQGILPLLEVKTWKGRTVKTAADHPFLTPIGWVQAQDLNEHSVVASVHPQEPCGTGTVSNEEARLLGYLVGDGGIKYAGKVFTNEDPMVVADFIRCAKACGFDAVVRKRPGKLTPAKVVSLKAVPPRRRFVKGTLGPVREWLAGHDLEGKCSYDKRVPAAILSGTEEIVKEFLGAYWSCDGHVSKRSQIRNDFTIGADTVSSGLALDIHHLLCRIGVESRLREKTANIKTKRQGDTYRSYTVVISNMADSSKFASLVPIEHTKGSEFIRDCVYQFDRVLSEDSVVSVTACGYGLCRCLTVEEDSSFTANDIAVHNSIIVAVDFPAWMWLDNPGWRSTFISYDSDLSTRDSVRCRDLMQSNWYQESFRPSWKFRADQNEKTYYVNTAKGFRVSTSITGKGTGWRGQAIIVDDPLNAKERHSDAALNAVIDWWDNVIFNRLDDMKTGAKVIIMQRLGDRDLAGHVLRKGGFEHLMIPMRYDPTRSKVTVIGWRDPRRTRDELMSPELFPEDVVQELEKNPVTFAGQYQQNPNVEGGGILRSHKWNYWQPRGLSLPAVRVKMPDGSIEERKPADLPDGFDLVLQSWDAAFKDLKTSDYVVGMVVGARGGNRYVLDMVRDRMSFTRTCAAIREMTGRHPSAHLKLIEDKANGSAVIDTLQNEIPGLVPVNPEGGKVARAQSGSYELESGNWYLPHPMIAEWVGDPERPMDGGGFIAESTVFPNGEFDDIVDSWSQSSAQIRKEKIGGEFGVSESDLRVEQFEIDPKWPRGYGLAVGWRETAAVWMVRKPETGEHYLYAEFSMYSGDPAHHAAEVRKRGDWIPGSMTAEAPGRSQKDGYVLAGKFGSLGLKLHTVPAFTESSLLEFKEALISGKLKVFGSLERFFAQYRMFRRDDKGKLPDYNRGVIDAAIVLWKSRDKLRAPPAPEKKRDAIFDPAAAENGWMGV